MTRREACMFTLVMGKQLGYQPQAVLGVIAAIMLDFRDPLTDKQKHIVEFALMSWDLLHGLPLYETIEQWILTASEEEMQGDYVFPWETKQQQGSHDK